MGYRSWSGNRRLSPARIHVLMIPVSRPPPAFIKLEAGKIIAIVYINDDEGHWLYAEHRRYQQRGRRYRATEREDDQPRLDKSTRPAGADRPVRNTAPRPRQAKIRRKQQESSASTRCPEGRSSPSSSSGSRKPDSSGCRSAPVHGNLADELYQPRERATRNQLDGGRPGRHRKSSSADDRGPNRYSHRPTSSTAQPLKANVLALLAAHPARPLKKWP